MIVITNTLRYVTPVSISLLLCSHVQDRRRGLQGRGQNTMEVLSRIDFGGLITFFLMVDSLRVFHAWPCDLARARSDLRSLGSA